MLKAAESLKRYHRNCNRSRAEAQSIGIAKAAALGKYTGRKNLTINDFPEFAKLHLRWKAGAMSKEKFARQLGVSRPTLDKLIRAYEQNQNL